VPTLIDVGSWKIRVYFGDHNPPHFHLVCSDGRAALVAFDDLRVLDGDVPAQALAEARDWAAGNRARLIDAWTAGR